MISSENKKETFHRQPLSKQKELKAEEVISCETLRQLTRVELFESL